MPATFTCAMCGGVFPSTPEDEAAAAVEKKEIWGDLPAEQCDIVCDGCWEKIRPDKNPVEYASYLASQN